MQKRFRIYLFIGLGLFFLTFMGLFESGVVFAHSDRITRPEVKALSSAQPAKASLVAMYVVNMSQVPRASAVKPRGRRVLPLLTGGDAGLYARHKREAAFSRFAPLGTHVYPLPGGTQSATPINKIGFPGLADSAANCPYFSGCQPADQALATSPSWVLQGVNTAFAVYDPKGVLQPRWPKTLQSFFRIPDPGGCDSNGPFLTAPRAFYDPNDQRFWAAALQDEGTAGLNSCPFKAIYWLGVSKTANPNGQWNIYGFDLSLGTANNLDFTQLGFDGQAVYISGNMFTQDAATFRYAEVFGIKKVAMETGQVVTAYGFYNLQVNGVQVDTVQPVQTEASSNGGPRAGLFINSFNIKSGGGNCFSNCNGVTIWALTNPGTASDTLKGILVKTLTYRLAPAADEPDCGQCINTFDTRISATPVYHNGLISFALETGVKNQTQVVPGILWGEAQPTLDDSGAIVSALLKQSGYYYYSGDGAVSFGAVMPDNDGNLLMVFDYMSGTSNPGVAYVGRRVTFTLGLFHDTGLVLRAGDAATFDIRWGDYNATSYTGIATDDIWIVGQYSPVNGDWASYIGRLKYVLAAP